MAEGLTRCVNCCPGQSAGRSLPFVPFSCTCRSATDATQDRRRAKKCKCVRSSSKEVSEATERRRQLEAEIFERDLNTAGAEKLRKREADNHSNSSGADQRDIKLIPHKQGNPGLLNKLEVVEGETSKTESPQEVKEGETSKTEGGLSLKVSFREPTGSEIEVVKQIDLKIKLKVEEGKTSRTEGGFSNSR